MTILSAPLRRPAPVPPAAAVVLAFAIAVGAQVPAQAGPPGRLASTREGESCTSLEGPGDYVVLLHGMNRSKDSMEKLARSLNERGYSTVCVDYPAHRKPIAEIAEEDLAGAVARLCPDRSRKVHFVGHSLGNIVIRQFIKIRRPPNLGRVVMLAPPNNGSEIIDRLRDSRLLYALIGPACRELTTDDSGICSRLGSLDFEAGIIMGTRPIIPFFKDMLGAESDGIVSVEGGKVEGMDDFTLVDAGHTLIMFSDDAVRHTVHFIAEGEFDDQHEPGSPAESAAEPPSSAAEPPSLTSRHPARF